MHGQIGDESPDVNVSHLKSMYEVTQSCIAQGRISAGHDISDGGIAVTLLEAAFAGNCGLQVCLHSSLFALISLHVIAVTHNRVARYAAMSMSV